MLVLFLISKGQCLSLSELVLRVNSESHAIDKIPYRLVKNVNWGFKMTLITYDTIRDERIK